ncbi:hypothetical protein BH20ACI2_BH20ACI2_24190 [soil metagenome]
MEPEKSQTISFTDFEIDARQRQLFRFGKAVSLNAKAFDLLLFLAENSGRVVSKEEIMDAVWHDQFVEESNLPVQMSAVRTALGGRAASARILVTIPGKGYQFGADVRYNEAASVPPDEIRKNEDRPASDSEFIEPQSSGVIEKHRSWRLVPILALIGVLMAVAAAILIGRSYFGSPEPIYSIAVLPFGDRNPDSADDYFGDGLAESVIFSLSRIPGLKVMSSDSAFRYRDLSAGAAKIGEDLGVASILTGRVTRADGSVTIRAELVSTADNSVIWGDQFTRKTVDIENLQIDIARSIARRLQIKLTGSDERLLEKSQSDNYEAFQLYLAGRYHLNRLTDDGFFKGRDSFQEAIAKDPNFALAHAGLAEAHNLLSGWGAVAPNDSFPLAKAAALRALELDESLAEAHTQLGIARLFYDLNWKGAEDEFKRAIEINPSFSDAHHMFAYALMAQGKFSEARAAAARAREMDPLSILKLITVGNVFASEGKPDEAAVHYRKALEMDSNSGLARWSLGNAYLQARRFPEAIEEFETAIRLSGDSPDEPTGLAVANGLSGNSAEARIILDKLTERSRKAYVPPALLAIIHGSLGEKDAAFELLEKAVRQRDPTLVFLKVDPYFDPLRSDPRFADLQKRLGLQ